MPGKELFNKSHLELVTAQKISDFSVSSGSNHGDNVGGSLFSIQATTTGGKRLNLIYKCLPPQTDDLSEDSHYVVKHRIKSVFRIETCMYEKIFPLVERLCTNKMKSTKLPSSLELPVPPYISGFNDNFRNDYVCLEDLRPQGFQMPDKYDSLTAPEVTLVMKEIGKFHALTHALIRHDGEKMFEEDTRIHLLKYNCLTKEDPQIGETFSRMFKCYFENTANLLQARDSELAGKVNKFTENSTHNNFHTLRRFNHNRTDKSIFPCIIHGDLWTNNILFTYASSDNGRGNCRDSPTKLKFIDFQLSRRSNVYEELGYFFWTSTTPKFRQQHMDSMLDRYYTAFEMTLGVLDMPLPIGFTRGSFVEGFYESVLSTYLYMPFALSLQMMGSTDEASFDAEEDDKRKTIENCSEADTWIKGQDQNGISENMRIILQEDKKLHKKRLLNSPKALQRLEDLTREVVDMQLL